jgi:uncharacterized protein (TIGR00369 family)
MTELLNDRYCFVCGTRNPKGLKLAFHLNESTDCLESFVSFNKEYQGWSGIVHGGLIATVLDEIMVKAAEFQKISCVTAQIKIKYKKPVKILLEYKLSAEVISVKQKIIVTRSKMFDESGVLVAEAEAKLFRIKQGE